MGALAYTSEAAFRRGVSIRDPGSRLTEAQRLGMALKRLRQRLGLSQQDAAARAQTYQQTWQRYESARNNALLRVDLQRQLAEAMGATHADLLAELDGLGQPMPPDRVLRRMEFPVPGQVHTSAQGFQVYEGGEPQTFDIGWLFGPSTRILPVPDDSMAPYAQIGGFVTYNVGVTPKENLGCVIEMMDGSFQLRLFERIAGGVLYAAELHPRRRTLQYDLTKVRGIHRVGVRGD